MKDDFIEVTPGIFIQSGSSLKEEQINWHDEDPSKNTDFSSFEFWVTTDNGVTPKGFDSIKDALIYLEEYLK